MTKGEIAYVTTDKSGRLAVMSLDLYRAAREVHPSKELTIWFVEETDKQFMGHTSAWLKILDIGVNNDHQERHRKTFIINILNIAEMYFLYKDYKFHVHQCQALKNFRFDLLG